MRSKTLPFHIQQNTTPEVLGIILARCYDGQDTISRLAEELAMNVGTVQHIMPFIRQMDLMEARGMALTDVGIAFHQLGQDSPILFPEAIHYLLYTSHAFDKVKRFSWAYARVADELWHSRERRLDRKVVAQLVGMVVEEATQTFDVPAEQVAFSRDSMLGVRNWLRALDPPTVTNEGPNDIFRRRYFCPAVTLLWAVDFLYRTSSTAYGVRLFLTPERIDQLCKVCVLDPSGLGNVMSIAKRMSDYERGGMFDYGTEGGFGRWILLARPYPVPTLLDTDYGGRDEK